MERIAYSGLRTFIKRRLVLQGAQLEKSVKTKSWWPGTESNRRRQPFQGCALPTELPGHAHAKSGLELRQQAARTDACKTASIIAKPAGLPQMRWVSLVATVLDCFLRSSSARRSSRRRPASS